MIGIGIGTHRRRYEDAFLPTDLADLFWWTRAGFGVTEIGGDVSQVDDFGSANLPQVQATGLDQPTLITNVINGHPIIRYDGVDHRMTAGVAADWKFMNDGSDYTVFIVFKTTDANPDDFYVLISTTRTSGSDIGFYISYDDRSSRPVNNTVRHSITDGGAPTAVITNETPDNAFSTQTFGIFEIVYDQGIVGDDSSIFVNGVLKGSSDQLDPPNNNDPDTGTFHIGSSTVDTFQFKGDFAEKMIYKRALSDAERSQVRNYLQTKFATP